MLELLLAMFAEISLFVGYIKNGVYPEPLSKEDEEYYVNELLQNKSKKARDTLIEHNLRLVVHIAKKYENTLESIEDLISIGTIGLIKAIDTYSTSKGVRLATYAAKCIDNEILMHLRANRKNNRNVSLFDSIGKDKDGTEVTLIDVIPSKEPSLEDQLETKNRIAELTQYLRLLNTRELEIITLRYGLHGNKELTQREVAKKYQISRSYVSRIEKRALTKLLQEFYKNKR